MGTQFVLSEYGRQSATPSPVNQMMASFASDFRDGVDVNLGVGYVSESTIPVSQICDALVGLQQQPDIYRLPFNYGGPEGTHALRTAIGEYLCHTRNDLSLEVLGRHRIIVGASGATSLLDGIGHVLPRGIVVTADPMYYIYSDTLQRMGFELIAVPEDNEGIRIDALEQTLARLGKRCSQIQFVYIVTVNNPTCTVMPVSRRRELLRVVQKLSGSLGKKVPLVLDRAYEDLIHDSTIERPTSLLGAAHDGLLFEVGTLSKVLAPALRIGYLIGSPSPFMDALVQRTSDVGFSAPVLMQEMAAHMLCHHMQGQLERVNQGYREKAQRVREMIQSLLGPHLTQVSGGGAGFYFYLTFANIETGTATDFFRHCTRTTGNPERDGVPLLRRVVYIPGQYCVHPDGQLVAQGRRQLRISYGFESLEQIEQGLLVMKEAVDACAGC